MSGAKPIGQPKQPRSRGDIVSIGFDPRCQNSRQMRFSVNGPGNLPILGRAIFLS
jgi:hypothetical protein